MPRSICTYKSGILCVFRLSAPLYRIREGQEIVAVGEKKKSNEKQNKICAEVRRQKQQTQSDFTGWMRGERSS